MQLPRMALSGLCGVEASDRLESVADIGVEVYGRCAQCCTSVHREPRKYAKTSRALSHIRWSVTAAGRSPANPVGSGFVRVESIILYRLNRMALLVLLGLFAAAEAATARNAADALKNRPVTKARRRAVRVARHAM